jgi:hypothetical protein
MAASVHNFILTWGEINLLQGILGETAKGTVDENSRNELQRLAKKLQEQRDCGYPALDYPFWRKSVKK